MNIISNSCCGAYLMREHLKTEYVNPFCWNVIDLKSYYYLIRDWDKINFLNYELVKDENWNFSIIIDEKIKVQYIHYLFDPKAEKLASRSKSEHDVLVWNRMWEYVASKYEERVQRMLDTKEKPTFIIADLHDNDLRKYDKEWLMKIDEMNSNFEIILFSNHYEFKNKRYYTIKERCKDNSQLSKYIYSIIKN